MMPGSNRRILEDVMPIRIIREVEKWPVIYKKDCPEMNNSHFRYKVWEEVAKNLFENYESYSETEKHSKVTGLMKRWRNLRDTFKRQLMVEKKIRAGHNIKRKEYVYFKHMAYLLPHMADYEPPAEPPPAGIVRRRARHARLALQERDRRRAPSRCDPPAALDLELDCIDGDKHFLLSLLPSFKRMTEDEKLTAKMEILKVIKDVKSNSMAIAAFTLAEAGVRSDDDDIVVKKELLTAQEDKSLGDCTTGDASD